MAHARPTGPAYTRQDTGPATNVPSRSLMPNAKRNTTMNTANLPSTSTPVDLRAAPRAWLCVAPDGTELLTKHEDTATIFQAASKGWRTLGLYAMPPEAAEYLLRHLRRERQALAGFVSIGNEVSRAKRLDDWIAALGA